MFPKLAKVAAQERERKSPVDVSNTSPGGLWKEKMARVRASYPPSTAAVAPYIYVCMCMYVCICMYMYVYVCICMYVCMCIYLCIIESNPSLGAKASGLQTVFKHVGHLAKYYPGFFFKKKKSVCQTDKKTQAFPPPENSAP